MGSVDIPTIAPVYFAILVGIAFVAYIFVIKSNKEWRENKQHEEEQHKVEAQQKEEVKPEAETEMKAAEAMEEAKGVGEEAVQAAAVEAEGEPEPSEQAKEASE